MASPISAQVLNLFEVVPQRYHAAVWLGAGLACRIGEALTVEDSPTCLDLKTGARNAAGSAGHSRHGTIRKCAVIRSTTPSRWIVSAPRMNVSRPGSPIYPQDVVQYAAPVLPCADSVSSPVVVGTPRDAQREPVLEGRRTACVMSTQAAAQVSVSTCAARPGPGRVAPMRGVGSVYCHTSDDGRRSLLDRVRARSPSDRGRAHGLRAGRTGRDESDADAGLRPGVGADQVRYVGTWVQGVCIETAWVERAASFLDAAAAPWAVHQDAAVLDEFGGALDMGKRASDPFTG